MYTCSTSQALQKEAKAGGIDQKQPPRGHSAKKKKGNQRDRRKKKPGDLGGEARFQAVRTVVIRREMFMQSSLGRI
jgi:hypothetical protein